ALAVVAVGLLHLDGAAGVEVVQRLDVVEKHVVELRRREYSRRLVRANRDRVALTAGIRERELQPAISRRRQLRSHVRGDEREALRQHHAETVPAQAADPCDVLTVHALGPVVLVSLVDQHAADAAFRYRYRQRRADLMILWIIRYWLVDEFQWLASARIVYLDVAALAPAACLVQKLGRAGAALLGQKLDPERLA